MCGRFVLFSPADLLRDEYQTVNLVSCVAHYNIPPSADIVAIISGGERRMEKLKWGLIPHWMKERPKGAPMINARAETVKEKPSFRDSFKRRRCLIPANGFFEWDKKSRQPYYISPKEGLFTFAGLWDSWVFEEGQEVHSCAIVTRAAQGAVKAIHDREPLILSKGGCDRWLEQPDLSADITLSEEQMQLWPVTTDVNKPANDTANLIEPLDSVI